MGVSTLKPKILVPALVIVVAAGLVVYSLVGRPKLPGTKPLITGIITHKTEQRIRVEENPAEESGSNKAVLTLTQRTKIYRETASGLSKAGAQDLAQGMKIRAWSIGPVAESYPVQTTARVIVILSGTDQY